MLNISLEAFLREIGGTLREDIDRLCESMGHGRTDKEQYDNIVGRVLGMEYAIEVMDRSYKKHTRKFMDEEE